jgi:hypothetical protein
MFKLFQTKEVTTTAVTEGMTLEQVRVAMLQLMAEENNNQYQMGQLYNYVVDRQLAEKAGYKDAKDFFAQRLADLSKATLTTYGAVAQAFSAPVARRFGVNCLALLLTYKEAADIEVSHEEPGSALIEVPDDKGQVTTKPFGECSVEQMRRALQRKRKPASSKPLPPEAEMKADQYREAVTSRLPRGTRVKVLLRNEKGKAVLDFKGIPLEQVEKLSEALMVQRPPVPEVQLIENAPPVQ